MPRKVYVKSHYRSAPRRSKNNGCPTTILFLLLLIGGMTLLVHGVL